MSDPIDPERVARLSAHLGLGASPTPFARGSVFVGHCGDQVLKLFPPGEETYAETEAAALVTLDGALPVPTPSLLARGDFEEHPYLLMRRLEGRELFDLWPSLDGAARADLGRQVGEMLAALHAIQAPSAVARPDWATWCAQRRAGLVEEQRRRRCPDAILAALPGFLEGIDLASGPTGFLHTEVMLDHLLVQPSEAGWRLSGVFDFEPAAVMPIDYELVSVGIFFAGGERPVFQAVLDGMGRSVAPGFSARMMAMFLMHRYCSFAFALRRTGADPTLGLTGLSEAWFGTG